MQALDPLPSFAVPEIPSSLSADGEDAVAAVPARPSEDLVNADLPAPPGADLAATDALASPGEDLAAGDAPVSSGPDLAATLPSGLVTLSPSATVARMAELFPALFGPGAHKPLKLRVQVDVQQRAPNTFTKKALSLFLQRHTTTTAYLKALSQAVERVDLDGQPAGLVSDEHREAAVAELQRRRALVQERRAAEQQAQRQRPPRAPRPGSAQAPDPASAQATAQAPLDAAVHAQDGSPRVESPGARREPRGGRPGDRPRGQRPEQSVQTRPEPVREPRRGDRPQGPPQDRPHPQPHRQTRQPSQPPLPAQPPEPPLDPARQRELAAEARAAGERAALLRAFESTTLTRANFCALKGLPEAELEAALVLARQDRQHRAAPSPASDRPARAAHGVPERSGSEGQAPSRSGSRLGSDLASGRARRFADPGPKRGN
jgi:sRNA-binding protein